MDLQSIAHTLRGDISSDRREEIRKEEVAIEFEKIFALKLVKELTKDSFKMDDNTGVPGPSGPLYRRHITETLANEIARQRKLGMADLISEHWKQKASF